MPLNDTQLALRWALTTAGVYDHLADVIVKSHKTRRIIEAYAYALATFARKPSAIAVKCLMGNYEWHPPGEEFNQRAIAMLGLEDNAMVTSLFPKEKQA